MVLGLRFQESLLVLLYPMICCDLIAYSQLLFEYMPGPATAPFCFRYKTFRRYIRKAFDDLGNPDSMVDLAVIRDSVQV